jgi:DNA (cytosine-5)-methyltransferase 1
MRVLDLFCGAGMAADGYAAAGYEVIGVDLSPQPDYPYPFIQTDAIKLLESGVEGFDLIHASPPCQAFTRAAKLREAQGGVSRYGDLLSPVLGLLRGFYAGTPWVVENVEDAKSLMPGAVRLCGSSFGLQVQRHRLFLSNREIVGTTCDHKSFPLDPVTGKPRPWGVYHVPGDSIPKGGRTARNAEHAAEVMGVGRPLPWASIKEGFPPLYTVFIGGQLL